MDGSVSVRLRGIDAPEKKQPYGEEARETLRAMIAGKTVTVDVKDVDRYGRVAGYVFVGTMNVNLAMVKKGFAWAYTEYLDRPYVSEFYAAESAARGQKLGLWQQANPTPPWEFRKRSKNSVPES
jgi:endonuclease YncB( thermonuclease family)